MAAELVKKLRAATILVMEQMRKNRAIFFIELEHKTMIWELNL